MSGGPFDFDYRDTPQPPPPGSAPLPPGPTPFGGAPGASSFGAPSPVGGPVAIPEIGRCPWWLLGVCVGLSLVAALVAVLAGANIWVAGVAWVLAGPLAFSTLALYISRDTRERGRGTYTAPTWAQAGYWVAVVVALVAVVVTAWRIAQWAGQL